MTSSNWPARCTMRRRRYAVAAERMFLHALGGGCGEPIAAYGEPGANRTLTLTASRGLIVRSSSASIFPAASPARSPARGRSARTWRKVSWKGWRCEGFRRSGPCLSGGRGPGLARSGDLRARELIRHAEVLVYDYLCNPALLDWAPADAERIYAGKTGLGPHADAGRDQRAAGGKSACGQGRGAAQGRRSLRLRARRRGGRSRWRRPACRSRSCRAFPRPLPRRPMRAFR